MPTFIDSFNRANGPIEPYNGWVTVPKFKIIDGAAVCEPLPGGGGRTYLLRPSSTEGSWTLISNIPDPVVLFPGGVYPKYFLMGCARVDDQTGFGVYWEVQWQYNNLGAYSDTYVRVWTISSVGVLEVTLAGAAAFPARAAGAAVDASMNLDDLGNIVVTTGGATRTGVIDAGAWSELTGNLSGISTDDNYQALPVKVYTGPSGFSDDFNRSNRNLHLDNGWHVAPEWQIIDGTARLVPNRLSNAAVYLINDVGISAGHWEWHARLTDPPGGYPGNVIFEGILRTTLDLNDISLESAIVCGVVLYYESADSPPTMAFAYTHVYAPDGDSPIDQAILFDAVIGESLVLSLDLNADKEFKLTINGEVLEGVSASDLSANLLGTYAGIAWTSLPIESFLANTVARDSKIVISDNKSTAPHGLYFEAEVKEAAAELSIYDPTDVQWAFQIVPSGGFLVGDVIHFSSEHNNKYLYLIRAGVKFSLIDSITPGSVWPLMFPGDTNLLWSPPNVEWNKIWYYPTYWGV